MFEGNSKLISDEKLGKDLDSENNGDAEMALEENEVEENIGKVSRRKEIASARGRSSTAAIAKELKDQPKTKIAYQVIQCDFCPMKYHKWSAFYVHRCTHTGETPVIPCGICEMEFPNIKGITNLFRTKLMLKIML